MSFFSAPQQLTSPKHIALVVFGGIGDVVLFSSVCEAIHQTYPETKLSIILERRSQGIASLLPGHPTPLPLDIQGQSKFRVFTQLLEQLKSAPFDAVIACGRSPFIALALWLSKIPIRVGYAAHPISKLLLTHPTVCRTKVYAGDMYFDLATSLLKEATEPITSHPVLSLPEMTEQTPAHFPQGKKVILLHPGVSLMSQEKNILKGWSAENWVALLEKMSGRYDFRNHHVVLVGGPDDNAILSEMTALLAHQKLDHFVTNAYGQTKSLVDLAHWIQHAAGLLCVDSAPMHLAIALQKPIVAMFGPTNPNLLVPKAKQYKVVAVEYLACRPCLWHARSQSCDRPVCLDVSVDAMFAATLQTF